MVQSDTPKMRANVRFVVDMWEEIFITFFIKAESGWREKCADDTRNQFASNHTVHCYLQNQHIYDTFVMVSWKYSVWPPEMAVSGARTCTDEQPVSTGKCWTCLPGSVAIAMFPLVFVAQPLRRCWHSTAIDHRDWCWCVFHLWSPDDDFPQSNFDIPAIETKNQSSFR